MIGERLKKPPVGAEYLNPGARKRGGTRLKTFNNQWELEVLR